MANVYLSLPVPAGDGVGAGVDVSTMGAEKTLSVDGGAFAGTLYIESSNDNQTSWGPLAVEPFTSDKQVPGKTLAAVQFLRVRRVGSTVGALGSPSVKVGAEPATGVYGALAVPAGNGVGALIDLTGGGSVNTFNVVGAGPTGQEQLLIEVSTDAGGTWSPAIRFTAFGQVGQNYKGVISSARVRRQFVADGAPVPQVSVGSSDESGGGGAFPGYAAPLQNWTQIKAGTLATVARSDSQTTAFPSPGSFVVFCLDYDGAGNDTTGDAGYSPALATPAATMAAALAVAQTRPLKTYERLAQLLPRSGNNATLVILGKPRAGGLPYRNIANTADADFGDVLNGINGWTRVLSRGSDLTNSAQDKVTCGFIVDPATNAAGYSAGAGSTTSSLVNILTAAGAAPALPLEGGTGSSTITAIRIRYSETTPTVALRNACAIIQKNGTDSIVPGDNLPAVPVFVGPGNPANDVFFIETPGLAVGAMNMTTGLVNPTNRITIAGMRAAASSVLTQATTFRLCGVRFDGAFSISILASLVSGRLYADEVNASIILGFSIRVAGTAICSVGSGSATLTACGLLAATQTAFVGNVLTCGDASVVPYGFSLQGVTRAFVGNSNKATSRNLRINNAISGAAAIAQMLCGRLDGVEFSNCTVPLISPGLVAGASSRNPFTAGIQITNILSTDGGNTNVVLDMTTARRQTVDVGTGVTATATAGDIRVAGGAICSFANLAYTNYPDALGNDVQGAAGHVSDNASCFTNASGFTLAAFKVVRGTGTTAEAAAAFADTRAHATGILGVCINNPANGAQALVVPAGLVTINFDAPNPANGGMAYLSDLTAGNASDALPTSGVIVELGFVGKYNPLGSGQAIIDFRPSPGLVPFNATNVAWLNDVLFAPSSAAPIQGLAPYMAGSTLTHYPGGVGVAVDYIPDFVAQLMTVNLRISKLQMIVVGETMGLIVTKNGAVVSTLAIPDGTTGNVSFAAALNGAANDRFGVAITGLDTTGGTLAASMEATVS